MARLSRPTLHDLHGETLGLPAREDALIETYYDRGAAVPESLMNHRDPAMTRHPRAGDHAA